MRIVRVLLRSSAVVAFAGLLPLVWIYVSANGPTLAGLVFAGVPLAFALLAFKRVRIAGAVAALGLLFVGWRLLVVPGAPDGWRFCEGTRCGRGPWWSYLAPEREAVLAGLELSRVTGGVGDHEYRSFRETFTAAYPREQRLPNPLLVWSTAGSVRTLVHVPPGKAQAPCIVFLHGFGGLLTAYLRTMADSELGRTHVLVAPALDPIGAWGTDRAEAVLEEVLRTLPPEADPKHVFLVGLSNGSIYGARYTPRFSGAVLLSGVGETSGGHVLVVSGNRDARVSIDYVREEVEELKRAGIDISLQELPADHGLILSQGPRWTALAADWFRPDAGDGG